MTLECSGLTELWIMAALKPLKTRREAVNNVCLPESFLPFKIERHQEVFPRNHPKLRQAGALQRGTP